ncbi:MAG: ParB N-terminal domain-containing protein [Betaproteobacteria bacterium]|nr:ParB N-terminal domain-containing protein [Betaproteobacteria bacterium]
MTPEASPSPATAPSDAGVTVLRVSDIEPYEHNPRHAANPLFETIKASIRQRGMDAPLKVTRRPGAAHYVVAAGGNTRLLAQLQLWQETADRRFETVPVVIKAWCSESDVLAGHLIENEQRSDLTFWDKAQGWSRSRPRWSRNARRRSVCGNGRVRWSIWGSRSARTCSARIYLRWNVWRRWAR